MKQKKHKNPQPYKKLRLKDNHSWSAPDGYKIVVLDRGAVSFNIPKNWIVAKTEPFEMHDNEPPDDNARLSITFWRFPPDVDWSGLPLVKLLIDSTKDSRTEVLERSEIMKVERSDLEMVWTQHRFLDSAEPREAYTRILIARGFGVHALITSDFWVDDLEKFAPMWAEVLRSLQLGRYIEDPTRGVVLQ